MDKKDINLNEDVYVKMELLGLELTDFRRKKEKYIKTCEKMVDYYRQLANIAESEISEKNKLITSQIIQLAQDVEWHETKTMKTFELPSIELIYKKEKEDIQLKDEWLHNEIPEEYIYTPVQKVSWQKLKSACEIVGKNVIYKKTGEILSSIEIIKKPAKFEIKERW